jgi:YggT family protein
MTLAVPVVSIAISIFIWLLIGRVILDAVQTVSPQWRPRGFMLILADVVYTITEPPVRLVRKLLPPLRLGPVMLDLGFLVLLIGLQVVQRLLWTLV